MKTSVKTKVMIAAMLTAAGGLGTAGIGSAYARGPGVFSLEEQRQLDWANAAARGIPDGLRRSDALMRLVQLEAAAGDIAAAEASAQGITDAASLLNALRAIATAQGLAGDRDGALMTLNAVTDPARRTQMTGEAAASLWRAGETGQARAMFEAGERSARAIDQRPARDEALRRLAIDRARAGDVAGALSTARLIGGLDEAKYAAEKIAEEAWLFGGASTMAACVDTCAAMSAATSDVDDAAGAALAARAAMASAENSRGPLATASRDEATRARTLGIGGANDRDATLERVAMAQAAMGRVEDARTSALAIENAEARERVLKAMATE